MGWQMSGGPACATAARHSTAAISARENLGERICLHVMDFLISFRIVSAFGRLDASNDKAVNKGLANCRNQCRFKSAEIRDSSGSWLAKEWPSEWRLPESQWLEQHRTATSSLPGLDGSDQTR